MLPEGHYEISEMVTMALVPRCRMVRVGSEPLRNEAHPGILSLSFQSPDLFLRPGNGVVIHLPGLFEEAAKNESKGNGELRGAP